MLVQILIEENTNFYLKETFAFTFFFFNSIVTIKEEKFKPSTSPLETLGGLVKLNYKTLNKFCHYIEMQFHKCQKKLARVEVRQLQSY